MTLLQDTIRELKSKSETETKAESPQIEMFDFKTKFAESKAFAKTIDMELRKLDVTQANMHVQLLQSFMAESFLRRGSKYIGVKC
jgi:dynactin 1